MTLPLEWNGGRASLQGIEIEQIAAESGTPFYLYDESALQSQFNLLQKTLSNFADIYYSVKANPHPKIVSAFLALGSGCEIASGGEYEIARLAGASPEQIVFAGPAKGREELEHVIDRGIGEIHVESFEEIHLLSELAEQFRRRVNVAVRVNPVAVESGGLVMGGQPTVFGFEEESLDEVVRILLECRHLRLRGVHIYSGTQILDAKALLNHWRHALDVAKRITGLTGEPVATIDLGGGLGIPYFANEKSLDMDAVREGVNHLIHEMQSDSRLALARVIVEPGRFLIGPAGMYVARVRSVKTCRGTTFVALDGGMNHHLSASGNLGQVLRRDYPIVNLSCPQGGEECNVVVVGPLCTPIDTLGRKIRMPKPSVGDLIGILQSGAYGMTASPLLFLNHPTPAEVFFSSGHYEVITERHVPYGAKQSCNVA